MKEFLQLVNNKVLILDNEGKIQFCSQNLLDDLQTTIPYLINKKLDKFLLKAKQQLINWKELIELKYHETVKVFIEINNQEITYEGIFDQIKLNENDIYYITLEDPEPIDHVKELEMKMQLALITQNEILVKTVKRELAKRQELEEELQGFAETASDLMIILKEDGSIKKVSGAWEAVLGWTNAELVGKHFKELIHNDDLKDFKQLGARISSTNVVRGIIYRQKCKDSSYKWVEWSIRYISSRQHYICTGRDISKEKEQERAKEIYEEALEIEKIKSEFFANMSHEFRTPLTSILATLQLLEKEIKQEVKQEYMSEGIDLDKYLSVVKQNTYRILRLANNIIELTSIDTGYCSVNLSNINIINIIEETALSVAEYVESRGIKLIFDTEVEEVITACDVEKIERIMLNILSNSIKYTSKGGVISIHVSLEYKNLVIIVTDTGTGIPEEKLNIIFNPFVHVDPTLTRKCEGIGVGLALVKSLVEIQGGTIEAKSEVGKGTQMIIRLPIKGAQQDKPIYQALELGPRIEKSKIEFSDIYDLC